MRYLELRTTGVSACRCSGSRWWRCVEIRRVVPFTELQRGFNTEHAIDAAAALHGRTLGDGGSPPQDVGVFVHREELGGGVDATANQAVEPRPVGDVSDRLFRTSDVLAHGVALVQYVEQSLGFHREPVDCVFDLRRSVGIEVAETTSNVRRAANLPKQP